MQEKLFSSKNRTEVSVGKKLNNDMLPEIEKVHKRKEKLLKKQHRQALMLDNMMNVDGLVAGRSLRDRKPVTYTFDDYDRSINEAIKVTKKKHSSPELFNGRDPHVKPESSANGKWGESSANGKWEDPPEHFRSLSFSALSPNTSEDDEFYDDQKTETLDRSNRRRQRPQRYSVDEFVEAVSDHDPDFDSDDDIVGEVVYHDDYLKSREKRRKTSSSSEGDEEYNWDEENPEEEEEEEDDDDSLSTSEDSGEPRRTTARPRALPGRTRRETRSRLVNDIQSGPRRSRRATRNRIDYKQYEASESENESMKPDKSNASSERSYASDNADFSTGSEDSDEENINGQDVQDDTPMEEQQPDTVDEDRTDPPEQTHHRDQEEEDEGVQKRGFLDLNELAPGPGFDDCP